MAKRKRRPTKSTAQLDIVIPVYGQPELLQGCLDSIIATKEDLAIQIIIVDDCGPDKEQLHTLYESLNGNTKIYRQPQNRGFPATVNKGISLGRAPFVLVLNSDIELQPGALKVMLAEFDNDEVGIVGPKLLFPPNSHDPQRPAGMVQHAGLAINFNAQIIHPLVGWSAEHPKTNEWKQCQAVTGACMMVRREVLRSILKHYQENGDPTQGPFNEVYGRGTYEDVELCFAARSLGWQVIYTPKATAYHYVGASAVADGQGFLMGRNEMIFRARCGQMLAWDEWRFT